MNILNGENMDYEDQENIEDGYDPDMYEEFGEGFETDFDAMSEAAYEKAFNKAQAQEEAQESGILLQDEEINEDDYEFDEVVGGRDKKPVMSLLNKGKLDKYELDDLLNKLE